MKTNIKKKIIAAQKPRDAKGHFIKSKEKYSSSPWIAPDPSPYDTDALPPGIAPHTGIKHVNIFRGIANGGTNIYRNLDEALKNSRQNAKAMRNDLTITEPILARELTLAQLEDHLVPEDEKDPHQKEITDKALKLLRKTPKWTELKRNLAEACWYGKMAVVLEWNWEYKNGERNLIITDWKPINGDKLFWRNNDKEFGYLVHFPTGLREVVYDDIGRAEVFTQQDMECVITHKYFIVDAPYDEPELGIGVHGFGLRHYLYWTWWMRQELLGWVFDCFQRYGAGGIQIWSYESGNPQSLEAVSKAAETQSGNSILLFPRPVGQEKTTTDIEIVSPDGAGIEWFYKFIQDYFNAQIRRLILGSASNEKEKISEGGSELIKSDFVRLLKYDAEGLSESITNSLVRTLMKYNFPEANFDIKYEIQVDKPDTDKFLEAAQRFYEMGGTLDENQIRSVIGLSEPSADSNTLKKDPMEDQTIKFPEKNIGDLGDQLS